MRNPQPHSPAQKLTLLACLSLLGLMQTATGQCDPTAITNGPRTGCDGFINAMTHWDPDGAGPQPEQIVMAGAFTEIATVRSGGIALYNEFTETWANLGNASSQVRCLLAAPNGDLLAGGDFATIDGTPMQSIARFDGSNWQSIGGGVTVVPFQAAQVEAIGVLNNGDIIIGGHFAQVDGTPIVGIARWDGTNWSAFGQPTLGGTNGSIDDMVTLPNGDLVVAGTFATIGGVLTPGLARWDGTSWLAMAATAAPVGPVFDLDVMPNGDLLCTGTFQSIGGITSNNFATWDGTNWSAALSIGPTGSSYALHATVLANGNILAIGQFGIGSRILWNGTQWQALGSEPITNIHAVTQLATGDILAGGTFQRLGPNTTPTSPGAGGLARWTNQAWQPEPIGVDGPVLDVLARGNGEYVAVGDFHNFADTSAQGLALHDGTNWQSYTLPPYVTRCNSVAELANGNLILVAGGQAFYGILRWVGPQGGAFIGNVNGPANVIVDSNNDVIMGGSFSYMWTGGQPFYTSFARYNSVAGGWTTIDPGFAGTITAMAALPNGALVVGGTLSTTGGNLGHIAIWNGVAWNNLNGNINAVPTDLTVLENGDIAVVGPFTQAGGIAANGVAIWNGSNWQAAGIGFQVTQPFEQPLSCAAMPDGGLLVGGEFTTAGNSNAQNLAYWRGGSWNSVPTTIDGAVTSIDIAENGDIMLGGTFLNVGGQPSAYAAQVEPICPAPITTIGVACMQAGALLDLQVTTAAWLGSSLQAVGSGLPNNSIAVAVYGTQTLNLPLSASGLPAGNCTLQVNPDVLLTMLPIGSMANTSLAIPVAFPLVGQTIHHQVVSFALGGPAGISSVGSTQGISATIGSLWQ